MPFQQERYQRHLCCQKLQRQRIKSCRNTTAVVRVLCTISYHDLVSYPVPCGLGTRLTVFDLHFVEPDWFATFDEQKAQKDAVYKLKVCVQYHLCIFFDTKYLHCTPTVSSLANQTLLAPITFSVITQRKSNNLTLYFQEEMQQRAKREARLKKLKEEHGSARWRAKRKVD